MVMIIDGKVGVYMGGRIKKAIYVALGFLFLVIGFIGAALPILPTTPFLILASFFFARGSARFNRWFLSTKLYRDHLEGFVRSKSMTLKTKVRILALATIMLSIGAYFASNIYARIIIICVIIYKYYYFIFNIETRAYGYRIEKGKENRMMKG